MKNLIHRSPGSLARLALGVIALAATTLYTPAAEAKFVFPYNHPDLEWYSIETEHFVIHYPQSKNKEDNDHYLTAEWTAKKSAKFADEMWARECAAFNYYIQEKVHIVILNQSDDLEGFTIPPWDWIEISANPGSDFYRQRGRMDWLPDVLAHEFAHVVSLKAQMTHAEGTQGVQIGMLYSDGLHDAESGGEMFISENASEFWVEGGAEYWSDESGYNWWTPSRDMHVRTTILEDRQLSWIEWQYQNQSWTWNDPERYYQQGYSFGLYLRHRFGHETYQKLGLENAKSWRPEWNDVFMKVLGVDGETLYNDWLATMKDTYGKQYAEVKAEGETVGRELSGVAHDWEYTDPAGRDKFMDLRWKRKKGVTGPDLAKIAREQAKLASGQYQMSPRISDDGKWYGYSNRGAVFVSPMSERGFTAFDGTGSVDAGTTEAVARNTQMIPAGFMDAWDFIPGQDALVVTGSEHSVPSAAEQVTGIRLETDGYDWKQLYVAPILTGTETEGNLTYTGHKERKVMGRGVPQSAADYKQWKAIPNTFRGMEPVVSPDGQRVAYFEYTDGTLNLVTIKLDGTEKTYLTHFDDGTWMQRADWSPDGKQIVVGIFRNDQQDLYVMNAADGSGIHPLMWDKWEDMDPHWANDGHIYFSSDTNGIFNVYAYDTTTRAVSQLTNVIGGAEAPTLTPEGNLVFANYTAHGWKMWGVDKADFLWKDVTSRFTLDVPAALVEKSLASREDLTAYKPEKYKGQLMAPTAVPMLRASNDGLDDFSIQAGAQVFVQDFVENHGAFVQALLGEDNLFLGQYFYQGWYPTLFVTLVRYDTKFNYGFLLDADENDATTADQTIYEGKNQQYANIGAVALAYPWNDRFSTTLSGQYLEYGFRTSSDTTYKPYQFGADVSLGASFNNINYQSRSANPYGGRNIDLTLTRGYTDVVYAAQGGHTVDDGQLLDAYGYDKVEARWTEQILVPAWGPLLTAASKHQHVIQLDFQGGLVDRNVDMNDEFRAGGQHPYYYGSDSLRPNTLFAGYPGYSLSGETMAIMNVAYRFPLRKFLNKKVGPFYFYNVTAQVMGSAGNLWSYRAPTDPDTYYRNEYGDRVARNPAAVRREIPFVDKAYKNGNYMLYDAGAEVRLSANLLTMPWNCFFRMAYGFNEIRGYGDVDGNDIQNTTDTAIGDELSNETEKPGPRFYLGLGTGW